MNTSNGLRPLILARGLLSVCLGLSKGSEKFTAAGFMWAREVCSTFSRVDVICFRLRCWRGPESDPEGQRLFIRDYPSTARDRNRTD